MLGWKHLGGEQNRLNNYANSIQMANFIIQLHLIVVVFFYF